MNARQLPSAAVSQWPTVSLDGYDRGAALKYLSFCSTCVPQTTSVEKLNENKPVRPASCCASYPNKFVCDFSKCPFIPTGLSIF
jgi:hypothetical protein